MDSLTYKNIKSDVRDKAILIVMLFIMLGTGIIARIPFYKLILFLYVQINVIFLSGQNIRELLKINYRNRLSNIFTSYAIGYAVTLSLYLITLIMTVPKVSIVIAYVISIINLIIAVANFKGKDNIGTWNEVDQWIALAAFLLTCIIMFFCFQARLFSAEITGYVYMHPDDQFWFKEAVEGTRTIPMPDFSISGVSRYYHYFSGAWCSFLHYLTGIEIFDVCYSLSWVGDLFLLIGGIYILFVEASIKDKYLVIAFIAILLTTGMQSSTLTFYINHLYATHFGFLPGYAMGLYTFVLFLYWYKDCKRKLSVLVLCIDIFIITLGLKSPCGCLPLVGIGIVCLAMLFGGRNRKDKVDGLIAGLFYFFTFISIYRLLFTYPNNSHIYDVAILEKRVSFSPTDSLFYSGYFKELVINLTNVFENKYVGYIVSYAMYLFLSNFVVGCFILLALKICIQYKIKLRIENIASLGIVICGYLMYTLMTQEGYSQVYFLFTLFPYGMFFALNVIVNCDEKCNSNRRYNILSFIALSAILILGVYKTIEYYIPNCASYGWKNLYNHYNASVNYPGSTGNDVNKKEMEALRWLRDNSDENALLITNLSIINDRSFTTSCYTERQIYIEGGAYGAASQELQNYRINLMKEYYTGSKAAAEVLTNEGVDYAVIFTSVEDYMEYSGKVIFENEAVIIIQL